MSVDEYLESLGKTLFLTVFPRAEKEEGLEPTQKVLLKSETGNVWTNTKPLYDKNVI